MTSHSIDGLSDGGLRDDGALKPCPFCGGTNLSVSTWDVQPDNWWSGHVACRNCDAQGASPGEWLGGEGEADAAARLAWNCRALSAAPERVEGGGWGERADEIYRAGMDAELPAHFQWGADAMEQFRFGKRRAVEEILRLIQGSASPPIGAEGGRPTSAGDSGCGEGTQEPSPSGAQRSDGKGE